MRMEPSLLDRITDGDAKASLRRDLAALLNNRCQERDWHTVFEQAAASVLEFGVVDFTSYNLNSSIDQERVRCSIERAIRQFEPRLARVVVTLVQLEPLHPVLNLRIEAELAGGDRLEPISIDGALDRASRRILVQGAA
jgi:type VI secretion system protein ImpF